MFAAAGVTILIVVLVRRRSVHKSTTLNGEPKNRNSACDNFANPSYELQGQLAIIARKLLYHYDLYHLTVNGTTKNGTRPAGGRDKEDSCYLTVPDELYARRDTYDAYGGVNPYEEPIYWAPADDRRSIYEQFTSKGFREITADQIQYGYQRNCMNILLSSYFFVEQQLSLVQDSLDVSTRGCGILLKDLWT